MDTHIITFYGDNLKMTMIGNCTICHEENIPLTIFMCKHSIVCFNCYPKLVATYNQSDDTYTDMIIQNDIYSDFDISEGNQYDNISNIEINTFIIIIDEHNSNQDWSIYKVLETNNLDDNKYELYTYEVPIFDERIEQIVFNKIAYHAYSNIIQEYFDQNIYPPHIQFSKSNGEIIPILNYEDLTYLDIQMQKVWRSSILEVNTKQDMGTFYFSYEII
jgi:hypothetical protein